MKHCPKCNATFVDDYLIYCTDDGTALVTVDDSPNPESQATQIFNRDSPTIAMPPPRPTAYVAPAPSNQPHQPQPYGWANEAQPAWTPAPMQQFAPTPARQQLQQNTAVVSLVLGIASITFGWLCGGTILGLGAVVLGFVALSQIKRNPAQYGGKPMAIGGLVTGGLALLIHLVLIAIWIVVSIIGAASR